MSKSSEKALMYSIGCGDMRAMRHLMDEYLDLVFRTSFRILCDRKDAEVVSQDVFVHAWNDAAAFDGTMSLEAWMLHHTCRYARMRIVRRRIMYIFGERPDLFVTTAPKAPTYDDYVTKQAWELYCRISVEMSITHRILFALCVLEGISEKDASVITGTSRRRISGLISSAESRFKKSLRRLESSDDYYRYIGFLRKVDEGRTEYDRIKRMIMASVR
jgi:RNA polymerase sigma-70 factor (ECF subfamily)